MAQLHLAFRSPVAAVESQDKRKLAHQLRELSRLTILIRQLEVRKLLADSLVHRLVSPLLFASLILRTLLQGGDPIPQSHYEATVNLINQETVVLVVRDTTSLAGFLGRKSNGEPGIKCLWLGIQRLDDIAVTWKFMLLSPRLVRSFRVAVL
jgi:hypothetical protein